HNVHRTNYNQEKETKSKRSCFHKLSCQHRFKFLRKTMPPCRVWITCQTQELLERFQGYRKDDSANIHRGRIRVSHYPDFLHCAMRNNQAKNSPDLWQVIALVRMKIYYSCIPMCKTNELHDQ